MLPLWLIPCSINIGEQPYVAYVPVYHGSSSRINGLLMLLISYLLWKKKKASIFYCSEEV